jgi:O-antigen ligase
VSGVLESESVDPVVADGRGAAPEPSGPDLTRSREGPLRARVAAVAAIALLAVPTVLAFFAGGYFATPRLWAGLVVWTLVVVAAIAGRAAVPRQRAPRLAVAGLALFAIWSLLSISWAPIAGDAYEVGQRLVLYLGALVAAVALLRGAGAQRAVEPTLAGGALLVICYGISERLLPGLLSFHRSVTAEGRLEQPLTYWNAMGELAAIGLVLAVRVAGDRTRVPWVRTIAAAATAPLGMGLYLTFSRGALFACSAGLVTLLVAAPTRAQLRAVLVSMGAGILAAVSAAPFGSVTSLTGSRATRELDGAITLVLLIVVTLATGLAQWWLMRREADRELRLPRRAPLITLGVVCAGLALAIVAGARESSASPLSSGATRLVTLESNRYDYWRVALHVFGEHPLRGVGAGGWGVAWLRLRPIAVGAKDAHSLPLQTAAELGIVGLALLGVFFFGVTAAARLGHRVAPELAAGPLAGFVTYAAHAPLDWDWEIPAVTLIALLLAGALLALADDGVRR